MEAHNYLNCAIVGEDTGPGYNSADIDNHLDAGAVDDANEAVVEGVWDNRSEFEVVHTHWE